MIGIIVLNYNNYQVTQRCVDSIILNPPKEEFLIVIVDNGSTNDSYVKLNDLYKDDGHIIICKLNENLGFAAGNNVGLNICLDRNINYCILSNSDIVFVGNTIDRIICDLRNNQDTVIIGPKIFLHGEVQLSSCYRKTRYIDAVGIGHFFPRKRLDEANDTGIHEVFSVSGCCFGVNIHQFKYMGAFDEGTFLYNEENILGIQAEKKGLKTLINLNISVIHNHGASTNAQSEFPKIKYIESTLYYWKKYRRACFFSLYLILVTYVFKQKIKHKNKIVVRNIYSKGIKYLRYIQKKN